MSLATVVPDVLLTYLLHSTVLVAVAWIGDRLLHRQALATRQALWRTALLGGIVTASLQTGLAIVPVGGSWGLPVAPTMQTASLPTTFTAAAPASSAAIDTTPTFVAAAPRRTPWLALWLAGFGLSALPLTLAYRRFRVAIADRREVADDVWERLRGVQRASGADFYVRLTACPSLNVPIAFGLAQPEICVPARGLDALTPEQQDGLLAHELAHLVRRDPLFLILDRLVAAALFFQPLNWLACRRLRILSEMACDSWAVAAMGNPVALAGCLAEVATWQRHGTRLIFAPAIGGLRSHLGRRVERLLDGSAASAGRWRGTRSWVLALAVTVAVAWVVPAVSLANSPTDKPTEKKADVDKRIVALDDAADAPADPPPPPPPVRPRQPLPPVHAKPPARGPVASAPSRPNEPEDDNEPERQGKSRVLESEIEEHAQEMAKDASRLGDEVAREMQPQIEALRHDVERTVQAALAQARREIERAAREIESGHRGVEHAHRAIEQERERVREQLREERRALEEEGRQLEEEKKQLEHDRQHHD